jgi:hypothetical protein
MSESNKGRVAIVEMDCVLGEARSNLEKIGYFAEAASTRLTRPDRAALRQTQGTLVKGCRPDARVDRRGIGAASGLPPYLASWSASCRLDAAAHRKTWSEKQWALWIPRLPAMRL